MSNDIFDYCREEVRKHDRERFLCAMLCPQETHPAIMALLAWNLEIAKVGEIASEPMMGFIRYQWWRDALEEIYSGKTPREHAVVQALAAAIKNYKLPKQIFMDIIAAREADVETAPFDSLEALDDYCTATGGLLLQQWLYILGTHEATAQETAEHVGSAWALIGTLRALYHGARRGKVGLPGMDADRWLQEENRPHIAEVAQEVAELAAEYIRDARALRKDIPKIALPPLYLAVLAEDYLERLKNALYDPFNPAIEQGRAGRALKLWWASAIKRY